MKFNIIILAGIVCLCSSISTEAGVTNVIRKVVKFNTNKDLLSLHYDHAPDKDDGHSAAADRTILESLFGADWIKSHVVAVSGTYGKNAKNFNTKSDAVMDVVWNDRGAWLAAHTNRKAAVATLIQKWGRILKEGGDVWVKEGGQSDITADTVKAIQKKFPDVDTTKRIHCIQHSSWNENQTTDTDLAYAKKQTHYVKIRDANAYLNIKGGNTAFETAATRHPVFGSIWKAAFVYYAPKHRLDFSDTGELMYILNLGELSIDTFRSRYLDNSSKKLPASRKDEE